VNQYRLKQKPPRSAPKALRGYPKKGGNCMPSTNYCIYLRKSRADAELERLGQGETLARHRRTLTELAERCGYQIGEVYEEIVSGETIAARPQMQRLLADVEQGRWQGVLVMELERLARGDSIDQGIVAQAFRLTGTLIITPQKVYDPQNEFDEEYFEFGLFMSRREYKTINRRLQAGRLASVKEGNYIGSLPPYGYDKVRLDHGEGYTLAPNEEAEFVRMIFEMFTQGATANKIADKLTLLGVRPKKGGEHFSVHSVRDILRNPIYTGKVTWNWREQKKIVRDGKVTITRPRNAPEKCLIYEGKHPAIISEELFNAAQERIGKTPKLHKSAELTNPYAHLCRCRECGRAMTYRPHKNSEDMLICPNKYCDVSGVAFPVADEIIRMELTSQLGAVKAMRDSGQSAPDHSAQTEHIKREIAAVKQQQNKLYDLLERGIYDDETFLERKKALAEKTESLNTELKRIEAERPNRERLDHLIATLEDLLAHFGDLDPTQKNTLLLSCVKSIVYFREKSNRYIQNPVEIQIELKF